MDVFINAVSYEQESMLALCSIGNHPVFHILLDVLFNISLIRIIYCVVPVQDMSRMEKEIRRWYGHVTKIECLPSLEEETFETHVQECRRKHQFPNALLLDVRTPLLSQQTLLDFIHSVSCSEDDSLRVCTMASRMRVSEDYTPLVLSPSTTSLRCINHCHYPPSELSRLDVIWISAGVESMREETHFYFLPTFVAHREGMSMASFESRQQMEDLFMQEKNAIFLYRCYDLLQKCESFDQRLSVLEKKISSDKG